MVVNAMIRNKDIPDPDVLRGIGCPSQITGTDWALWVPGTKHIISTLNFLLIFNNNPATVFEVVLFLLALYACSTAADGTEDKRPSLISVLISENVLHFFLWVTLLHHFSFCVLIFIRNSVASLLLFYDLMVAVSPNIFLIYMHLSSLNSTQQVTPIPWFGYG